LARPEVCVEFAGGRIDAKTQAVNVANGPYVGASVAEDPVGETPVIFEVVPAALRGHRG
jgi:hypothetical protein